MTDKTVHLIASQLQLLHSIETSTINLKKLGKQNWTAAKLRTRIQCLKETWMLFFHGHADLLKVVSSAAKSTIDYFVNNVFDAAEECYLSSLDFMSEVLEDLSPTVSVPSPIHNSTTVARVTAPVFPTLPQMNLAPFDGSYDEWEPFRDRFTALIILNKDIQDFARMHYLMSCLKGRALECVKDLAVTAENFNAAWKMLTARFENKHRLLNLHLSTLLNLPPVSRKSARELQSLLDTLNSTITSLKNLNREPADLWNDMLVFLGTQKVDFASREAWNLRTADPNELPLFDDFLRFMSGRARALENLSFPASSKAPTKTTGTSISNKISVATAVTSVASPASASAPAPSPCPICNARHYFSACPSFVKKSSSQRRELVQRFKRCFNCLSQHHSVRECRSKFSCRVCKQKHHSLLHLPASSSTVPTGTASSNNGDSARDPQSDPMTTETTFPIVSPAEINSLLVAVPRRSSRLSVLLATAWVSVRDDSGRSVQVRALIDQGSEMTFVSERVSQTLRVHRFKLPVSVSAIGGVHAGTFHSACRILISPLDSFSLTLSTTAIVMKKLTSYAPRHSLDLASFAHLQGLKLADCNPSGTNRIDLIIGSDLYGDLLLDGLRKGSVRDPIAQKTVFGWIISGPVGHSSPETSPARICPSSSAVPISAFHCSDASSLDNDLRRFWEAEEPLPKSFLSQQCESHFQATHSRASDGRYIVRLPFNQNPPIKLGDTRTQAQAVLNSLVRRFSRTPALLDEYREFMTEYEHLGHMKRVDNSSDCTDNETREFIPHHPVFRADSSISHLRVVFNASSPSANGLSLNNQLFARPKLQTDLSAVIFRWRQFKFMYAADIAKMYRQIWINSRDLHHQNILWKTESTAPENVYQLLTVMYGMVCAPFLALRVLKRLSSDEGHDFPLACPILKNNIYVDDVLFGDHDIKPLRRTRDQLVNLLLRGGFSLRKWASNDTTLLSDLDPANHGLACSKTLSPDDNLKVLDISWNPNRDAFQFSVKLETKTPTTKRAILSAIAKLYDPLRWVTPVIIQAKILIQQLWKLNLLWDTTVPPTVLVSWEQIYSQLFSLNGLQIPRWIGLDNSYPSIELHGFADASHHAYAAVVYLKVTSLSGKSVITILAGKSRVAPLKVLSIPRLELSANVLLARLLTFIRTSLELSSEPCFCWTDSTIVLAWLNQSPSRWKTFVANRVSEIQSLLPNASWRHMPTAQNPADCASRGLLGADLLGHDLWWRGPPWLSLSSAHWPHALPPVSPEDDLEEKPVSSHIVSASDSFDLASRFSSWPKLIRIIALLFRFLNRCRRSKQNESPANPGNMSLTAAECDVAKKFWIRSVQRDVFP